MHLKDKWRDTHKKFAKRAHLTCYLDYKSNKDLLKEHQWLKCYRNDTLEGQTKLGSPKGTPE